MQKPQYAEIIEYERNGLIEQTHAGIILHMNKDGIINRIGNDNDYPFYMRSCMKPLQSSALIDLKIDEKYGFTEEETAVCCASHTGSEIHQRLVRSVLSKIGLSEDYLLCAAHEPLSEEERRRLILNGLKPQKIHNNCSGKHAAMLAVCIEKGFSVKNYKDFGHPLTDFIIERVCRLCRISRKDIIISRDGCGLPVIAAPLEALGRGYLNIFTNPQYNKITSAFLNNPFIIGGEGRLDTEIIMNTENIAAKTGACGLLAAVNIERREALIIKAADSNMEARALAADAALKQLKWTDKQSVLSDNKWEIKTLDNEAAGRIKPCFNMV